MALIKNLKPYSAVKGRHLKHCETFPYQKISVTEINPVGSMRNTRPERRRHAYKDGATVEIFQRFQG